MKKLFFGTINEALSRASEFTGTYFPKVNDRDEERRISFFIYDFDERTFNGKKLLTKDSIVNFINEVLDKYTFYKLSCWYCYNTDFDKNFQRLIDCVNQADSIAFRFKSSDDNIYHFKTIMVSILGKDRMSYDYDINRSFAYELRSIISSYKDSKAIDETLAQRLARNLVEVCKDTINKYISDYNTLFEDTLSREKLNSLNANNLEALSYLYTVYNYANRAGLVEEINDSREYLNKFIGLMDNIISTDKSNEKDAKAHKKFVSSLSPFEFYYSYCFTDNIITSHILEYNINLLKHKGVNKQTLTTFINNNSTALSILSNLDNVNNKDVIGDKIDSIIKRNENNLNNNVFKIAYKYFKNNVEWDKLDKENMRTHFNDDALKDLGIEDEIDTKYYREIIDLINEAKYPFNEFANVVLMINELSEKDFKCIVPILSSALYKFIHKNLTANDSYRYITYSYGKYFSLLKDKDDNYYNEENVKLLFKGLFDNSSTLNSSMKKKLTIFCMQCGLDGLVSDMKDVPKDYKTISMELKMKK